jgi:hypothetical protein
MAMLITRTPPRVSVGRGADLCWAQVRRGRRRGRGVRPNGRKSDTHGNATVPLRDGSPLRVGLMVEATNVCPSLIGAVPGISLLRAGKSGGPAPARARLRAGLARPA